MVVTSASVTALAQSAVQVGRGSYAAYTPLSKCRSDQHSGDQSRYMQYRQLNIRERSGQPIPTNDWWTNMINADDRHVGQELTGHLWSYPQFIQGMRYGLDVQWPSYWIADGTEMKSRTVLQVRGDDFEPTQVCAEQWHDWDVQFSLTDGDKRMLVTMAHGLPFTWIETRGFSPQVPTNLADGTYTRSQMAVKLEQDGHADWYGLYFPDGTTLEAEGGVATVKTRGSRQFVVVALLHSEDDLELLSAYAYSVPRRTTVTWDYTEATGLVQTHWSVQAEDLRTGQTAQKVLQGFLPHHYRAGASLQSQPAHIAPYRTPHGLLCLCEGQHQTVTYTFHGMLPYYGLPSNAGFDTARMRQMIAAYAANGTFGADTYWGGKGLTQMALYMTFAREMGEEELFAQCRDRLKAALVDWLTYTPGESHHFFARDERFGGLIGYDTSYDSETYNDHHFHYGYYTLAGALLALVDDDFRQNYGQMLRLVTKDYANWERDSWACFLRTFDPWGGHSFAGGMGDGNGNGQESSSEAMQGWGGLYLLGVALGDNAMRDAGIFGWVTEARATAEYWFDRHGEDIEAATFHQGLDENYNIDYTRLRNYNEDGSLKYIVPYNSNFTCHGVGWWTYFSGDPVWMAGIQWMPISPALDYLSEDLAFAAWDFQQMWNIKEIGGWYDYGNAHGCLGEESGIGNVVLSYLQRSDPQQAAQIFDNLWAADKPLARNTDTGGITYYVTHSHLTHGELTWNTTASIPTARAYRNDDDTYTLMAYNPGNDPVDVTFYADGSPIKTLKACAPRQLTIDGVTSKAVTTIVEPQPAAVNLLDSMEMRNIALGRPCYESSHENVGTVKENATDGDLGTRWGSQHSDGEWLTVDLGQQADIYRVRIHWEAAFASQYELQVSDNNESFRPVATAICSQAGWVTTDLADGQLRTDARGRYLRVVGLQRATPYGISLHELCVYGRLSSMTGSDIVGLKISADRPMLTQGQPSQLTARGYAVDGTWHNVDVQWSSADGDITADGVFTPSAYGMVTVTAKAPGLTIDAQLPCEEGVHAVSLRVSPEEQTVLLGSEAVYEVICIDQFGTEMSREQHTYDAGEPGDHQETVSVGSMTATATFHVVRFQDINLALGSRAKESSAAGTGSAAARATDGDMNTRWESRWQSDDEWILLDLRATYMVDRFVVAWEAAFATAYEIAVSEDGSTWQTVYDIDNFAGGQDNIQLDVPVIARYVKLQCRQRALEAYGYSLYELEVYGTESATPTHITQLPYPSSIPISSPTYDLTGRRITSPAAARSRGLYIRNHRKYILQ